MGTLQSEVWRERAEEYRQFADDAQTDHGRAGYLAVAANCDMMAARLEKSEDSDAEREKRLNRTPPDA
jgi:hypothetical protein